MVRFFSIHSLITDFVPKCLPVKESDVLALSRFINQAKNLLVLTGAGLSTESGIPDYRSQDVGLYARSSRRPVQFQDFIKDEKSRRRYWARNFLGWPQFSYFEPNINHKILAEWERMNKLYYIVTQNVDRLHTKAGSSKVIELHGTTHRVICLNCGNLQSRFDLQDHIMLLNSEWMKRVEKTSAIAPDGDVLLSDDMVAGFQVPACDRCGGVLKPDVVFFGENVAQNIVGQTNKLIDDCDSLFVAGSSLFVYSGYRFVLKCREEGKKIGILNIGPTRADDLANLKIEARCGEILPKIQLATNC